MGVRRASATGVGVGHAPSAPGAVGAWRDGVALDVASARGVARRCRARCRARCRDGSRASVSGPAWASPRCRASGSGRRPGRSSEGPRRRATPSLRARRRSGGRTRVPDASAAVSPPIIRQCELGRRGRWRGSRTGSPTRRARGRGAGWRPRSTGRARLVTGAAGARTVVGVDRGGGLVDRRAAGRSSVAPILQARSSGEIGSISGDGGSSGRRRQRISGLRVRLVAVRLQGLAADRGSGGTARPRTRPGPRGTRTPAWRSRRGATSGQGSRRSRR